MSEKSSTETALLQHGAAHLPGVNVDAYNAELRDGEGFIGDRASNRAFRSILEDWRERLRRIDEDPLGETPSEEIGKKKIDKILADGDPEAAGLVHGVIEEFAQELVAVIHRLLRLKTWRDTQRIVVGGGLRDSRAGELTIGRAAVILKGEGYAIDLSPIRRHPDEAGLIGAAHLAPSWLFEGHDSILGVDIGGSNFRAGVVQLNLEKQRDLSCAKVWESELWRHADEEPTREQAVERLAKMLRGLIARADKKDLRLAPFVGIGCPGLINEDGSIERGGQNLPGNWESKRFNLSRQLLELIPRIGEHEAMFLMHNDAVLQGLSELPFVAEVERWGVLTIGTGLGNARFTNRRAAEED
jgi:predicted NBD/HSP70 family sugar kinase